MLGVNVAKDVAYECVFLSRYARRNGYDTTPLPYHMKPFLSRIWGVFGPTRRCCDTAAYTRFTMKSWTASAITCTNCSTIKTFAPPPIGADVDFAFDGATAWLRLTSATASAKWQSHLVTFAKLHKNADTLNTNKGFAKFNEHNLDKTTHKKHWKSECIAHA